MDTQTSIQKRKRANTVQNEHAIDSDASNETTIVCDTSHLNGKPSNIEDDSDDSNVDQPNDEPLKESTLFKPIQLVISCKKDHELGLAKPSNDKIFTLSPSCKIFII
jgi:hypothetical protein